MMLRWYAEHQAEIRDLVSCIQDRGVLLVTRDNDHATFQVYDIDGDHWQLAQGHDGRWWWPGRLDYQKTTHELRYQYERFSYLASALASCA